MIFQSLISLYDRLAKYDRYDRLAKKEEIPPYGFSVEDIGFVITIDKEGNLVGQPEDLRIKKDNTYSFRTSVVPYTNKVNVRSGNASTAPNFMVDKADYIFGMSGKSKKDVHQQSFKKLIDDICGESRDEGVFAAKAFLSNWNSVDSAELKDWKEICGNHGKWVAFRLQGDSRLIHERPEVKKLWTEYVANEDFSKGKGICLVDGEVRKLQRQYAQFKFGKGAPLTTFNKKAFESYGKERGENAPISIEAEFKSSAALKYLFRSKTQRIWIGDAVTVFWAEKDIPLEGMFGQILNPYFIDREAERPIRKFLEAVIKGTLPREVQQAGNLKFYILGFAIAESRLALRFSYMSSVRELMERLRNHFCNLEIEPSSENDFPYPSIKSLLRETVFGKTPRDKDNNVSPVLGGALARSILTGALYPQNLYQGVLGRIRADHRVNYLRVSILKAVLQRNHKKEVPMSLGRLFAALEKAQLDALGKINSTIKDRFFSAASATPASVFPRLIRLSQHHIDKAEYGYVSDRRISEIMEHIDMFPAHMNLQDQGLFAIAYYQQKNAITREIQEATAKKKAKKNEGEE